MNNVISIKRTFNIGNYENFSIEKCWNVADPDKTLRSSAEEHYIASLSLMKSILGDAMKHVIRIHNIRNQSTWPKNDVLFATTNLYQQLILEIQAIDFELSNLEK